jgi:hypothetical protein
MPSDPALDGGQYLSYAEPMLIELTVEQGQELLALASANGVSAEALAMGIPTWARRIGSRWCRSLPTHAGISRRAAF